MRHLLLITGLGLLLSGPLGAESQLDAYLLTAAEKNPGLRADFAKYLAAVEKVAQVGTLPDPTAAFGYFASPTESRVGPIEAKISLAQRFPWFGLLDAREHVATEKANGLLEKFREHQAKLFYEIKSSYFELYFASSSISTTRENLEILDSFRQLALIKVESGKVSGVDELRIEMDLADLDNQLAQLEDRMIELRVRFNNLLNVSPETEVAIPELLEDVSFDLGHVALFSQVLEGNHSLREIEHRVSSWQLQEKVAQKEGAVDFQIGLDYSFVGSSRRALPDASDSGQDSIVFPMIGVTIPLYRKRYRAMVAEAQHRTSASSLERVDRVNQLRSSFETAYKDYRDGERRVMLFEEQGTLANQALDLLLAEYSTDGSNFEEVLRMERRALGYNLALERARADKRSAVAFIELLLGS